MKIWDISESFEFIRLINSFNIGDFLYSFHDGKCHWTKVEDGGVSFNGINEWLIEQNIPINPIEWSNEHRILFQLTWS